jgi:hypothetical protein
MHTGGLITHATNFPSQSKHYMWHAVIHGEINANMLNQFIFIAFRFRLATPIFCNSSKFKAMGNGYERKREGNKGMKWIEWNKRSMR